MESRFIPSSSFRLESEGQRPQRSRAGSLPRATTPPLQKARTANRNSGQVKAAGSHEKGAESVDADALSRALKEFRDAGKQRDRTPAGSPSRKRQRVYGDRSVASTLHHPTSRFIEGISRVGGSSPRCDLCGYISPRGSQHRLLTGLCLSSRATIVRSRDR